MTSAGSNLRKACVGLTSLCFADVGVRLVEARPSNVDRSFSAKARKDVFLAIEWVMFRWRLRCRLTYDERRKLELRWMSQALYVPLSRLPPANNSTRAGYTTTFIDRKPALCHFPLSPHFQYLPQFAHFT